MKKRKNKLISIISLFLSLVMAMQGSAIADVMVSISLPIIIKAKITTHPDAFKTFLPLRMTTPVVCDLDGDWVLEVIGAGYNSNTKKSSVFVWSRSGVIKTGWPKEVDGKIENVPAIGDLDGDGNLEIVVGVANIAPLSGGKKYVFQKNGALYAGYPENVNFTPGAPVVGDVNGSFEEEALVYESDKGVALCEAGSDGGKEIIKASAVEISIEKGDGAVVAGWPIRLNADSVGTPVAGDADGDGKPEVFLAVKRQDANYIYGWKNDGTIIAGWPINIGGVINAPGSYLSIADINGDGVAEIISGSANGYLVAWQLDKSVVFSVRPLINNEVNPTNAIYQPIVADINNDDNMEVMATSKYGNVYCYDANGNPINGWPYTINSELAPGAVLCDIEMDAQGDVLNSRNDLELLFSANDGQVHSIDLPGDFYPNKIQWGMQGFNSRNSGNYLRDWNTAGWSIFDNDPAGASIKSVYDWNRGGRVVELKGAGLNNCYAFKKAGGQFLNSKDTKLQWSMLFGLPFNIYVSVNTLKGMKYLHYTATEGNQLADPTGVYIHHGLGTNANNGKWHTFSRQLVQDLKDADAANSIISVNAVYIQGSGRIDDLMLLPGLPVVSLNFDASSGSDTLQFINDGDPNTKWVSGNEPLGYTFENPQTINKVFLEGVNGADSGIIFIIDSEGIVHEVAFNVPAGGVPFEVSFDAINNVKSIVVVFNNVGGFVEVGELNAYYDGTPEQQEFTTADYIRIMDGYFFNPVTNNYWVPHGIAYLTWNDARGQYQTPAELRKDLGMMKEAGVNAIRVDFAWKDIENVDGVYDWANCDMLVEEAQAKGIKVFPIIGSQIPPRWFNDEWYSMHPKDANHPAGAWKSDVISYENTNALEQIIDFLHAVVTRYSIGGEREDLASVIAGWIIGNQFDYINPVSNVYDGYDAESVNAFRAWLSDKYQGEDFSRVSMPISPDNNAKAGWADLNEWRKESIANFVAKLARAVKDVETLSDNSRQHLITYASLFVQAGEDEWVNRSEDAAKINQACNGLLDFWSINNYPWVLNNKEPRSAEPPVEKVKTITGLPVMVTETGFTSTETIPPGISEDRQARLVRNAVWNTLESGAIGVCVFHWNDRDAVRLSEREKGFGVVDIDRNAKPAYSKIKEAFQKMDLIKLNELLPQFTGSIEDIQITGSPYILAYYRAKADNSQILFGFNNYSSDASQAIQLTTDLLTGKEIKDLINDVVIPDDSSDAIIVQTIEADGHSLILAYAVEPVNDDNIDQGDVDVIPDGQGDQDGISDNTNTGSNSPADYNLSGGTTIPDLSQNVKQPAIPQSTVSPVSAAATTLISDTTPKNYYTGPAIIIAGVGVKKEEEVTNGQTAPSTGLNIAAGTGSKAGIRTYTGMVTTGGNGSNSQAGAQQQSDDFIAAEVTEQGYQQDVIKEYPALEQFRAAMAVNNNRGEVVVVKAQPVTVAPERMRQMIQVPRLQTKVKIQAPAFDVRKFISSLIYKVKGWAKDLTKKTRFKKR